MAPGALPAEAASRADFSHLRYAQCWEDADVLVEALAVRPGDTVLSIASAGDNTLALAAQGAGRVVAVDLNPAQLAALALRVAAYRVLAHGELLELLGSRPSARRDALYARCRPALDPEARRYWDGRPDAVAAGVGGAGRFERFFALFRRVVLPLVHRRATVEALMTPRHPAVRAEWFDRVWDTRLWRLLFRCAFSERVLGRVGRDPSFYRYAQARLADHLRARVRHAAVTLDPAANPYLQWVLTGEHRTALPYALRPEQFDRVRAGLDAVEWHRESIEGWLGGAGAGAPVHAFNLSDIFEYVSPEHHHAVAARCADAAAPGARLAYWNLLAPRRAAPALPGRLRALDAEAARLFAQDKAFFYSAFVLEEVAA